VRRSERSRPWREGRYVVVDLETTGLDPRRDEIVSFGAVPIDDGRIHLATALHLLVRPACALPERSILVHGIRPQELAEAPPLAESREAIAAALADRVVVAHAAFIERGFLRRALGRRVAPATLIDTVELARLRSFESGRGDPGFQELGALAATLGLPVHEPHHALGDALTTAQVFLALASHLEALHPRTVGDLARASDLVRASRRLGV